MANQKVRRLYRSRSDRIIAGVCGGLASYLSIDSNLMRIIYVLLLIFTGVVPLVIIYLLCWILVPPQP